jgi:hypothetical protein
MSLEPIKQNGSGEGTSPADHRRSKRRDSLSGMTTTAGSGIHALEKHYTPAELAVLWGLSPDFIRDRFRDEPGVLKIDRPERMRKRGYCTIRIPQSVASRVHRELQAA